MSQWTEEARGHLWVAVWHAIGEAHYFLVHHPRVYPSEVRSLFHAAAVVEIALGGVLRMEENDRRDRRERRMVEP